MDRCDDCETTNNTKPVRCETCKTEYCHDDGKPCQNCNGTSWSIAV